MQIDRFSPLVAAAVLALFAAAPALGETDAATLATQRCAVCHGARGESSNEQFPQLAGQNARYLSKQLQDFASGARTHVAMNVIARELSGEQIEALAQHYERLKPQAHPGTDPLLANVGRYIWGTGQPVHAGSGVHVLPQGSRAGQRPSAPARRTESAVRDEPAPTLPRARAAKRRRSHGLCDQRSVRTRNARGGRIHRRFGAALSAHPA